jgi:dTDP-4-dehydrorhamnose 3,5-epimerase
MHFQLPPDVHDIIIYCCDGKVLDVVFDLRKGLGFYGHWQAFQLSRQRANLLFISRGCAHGFCTVDCSATVVYMTIAGHQPNSDTGIRWDSFGLTWPVDDPVMSQRDRQFVTFEQFVSPF